MAWKTPGPCLNIRSLAKRAGSRLQRDTPTGGCFSIAASAFKRRRPLVQSHRSDRHQVVESLPLWSGLTDMNPRQPFRAKRVFGTKRILGGTDR